MEEGSEFTPDITDSVLQQPLSEPWTSINHRYNDVEQEGAGACSAQMERAAGTDGGSLSPDAGLESREEAELREWIVWPPRPVSCPLISFATAHWDFPRASAETDNSSANEPGRSGAGGVTEPDGTSLSPCESLDAELVEAQGRVELDGFDSQAPDSDADCAELNPELVSNDPCCNLRPCDAPDEQEPETQEKEDSQQELPDSEAAISWTNAEEEHDPPGPPDPDQGEDSNVTPEENRDEEEEAVIFLDVKLEEEQEEPRIVLTEQRASEGERASVSGGGVDEGSEGEVESQPTEIYVSCHEESEGESAEDGGAERFAAELLQTDDTGLSIVPDGAPAPPPSELLADNLHRDAGEDPAGQSDGSKAADGRDGALIREAENTEATERHRQERSASETRMTLRDSQAAAPAQLPESEQCPMTEQKAAQVPQEGQQDSGQSGRSETEQTGRPETAEWPERSARMERAVGVEQSGETERRGQTEPAEQNERSPLTADSPRRPLSEQPVQSEKTNESEATEQLSGEAEVTRQTEDSEANQADGHAASEHSGSDDERVGTAAVVNGESPGPSERVGPHVNGGEVDREKAGNLAERLFQLDGFQRADVVKHLDKDNDFSRAVGEEYLKFFDFTGQTLDGALRSFLKVVVLIGETQERERVLQHFSCRFHQCNPDSFASPGAALALTCALMLLNTDLHGQHVGKSMSSSKFVSNLDEMNEGGNFSKDLLKSLYNSIKSEPLQWAVDEEELKSCVLLEEDAGEDAPLRSKANPFQDVPHDKQAAVVKQGFLQRKLHADIDGKRTPWGKRGWKTFYGVLRGMVLYLQKDDYRRDQQSHEEVVSVHHSLAEWAADYNKKPHVFRLQTADWRVFLFQASSKAEMNSWIGRINLISALHSSPPFPSAVGSQRRFCRPILPASQSAQTLEHQLQSHTGMLESFKADLAHQLENPPEGRKAKAKELEEHRVRAEYLQFEVCRYESYMQVLDAWSSVEKSGGGALSSDDLDLFDKGVCTDSLGEEEEAEEEGALKRSHSSPSLELESAPPPLVKVKRNISERRTYRRAVIPRRNKEV